MSGLTDTAAAAGALVIGEALFPDGSTLVKVRHAGRYGYLRDATDLANPLDQDRAESFAWTRPDMESRKAAVEWLARMGHISTPVA